MSKINNWFITKTSNDCYKAPELWTWKICGVIQDDSRFDDGQTITTSEIKYLDIETRKAKTSSGTEYDLGNPDMHWMKWLLEDGHKLSDFNK